MRIVFPGPSLSGQGKPGEKEVKICVNNEAVKETPSIDRGEEPFFQKEFPTKYEIVLPLVFVHTYAQS